MNKKEAFTLVEEEKKHLLESFPNEKQTKAIHKLAIMALSKGGDSLEFFICLLEIIIKNIYEKNEDDCASKEALFEKLKDSYYSLKKAWAEGSEQRGLIEYQNYLIEYLQNFEVDLYKLEEKIKEKGNE